MNATNRNILTAPYRTIEVNSKKTVNCRRFNKMQLQRKLRIASFVNVPRLVRAK